MTQGEGVPGAPFGHESFPALAASVLRVADIAAVKIATYSFLPKPGYAVAGGADLKALKLTQLVNLLRCKRYNFGCSNFWAHF